MPDSTLNYNGDWPYLDQNNYLDATPGYTADLAEQLKTTFGALTGRVSTLEGRELRGAGQPHGITAPAGTYYTDTAGTAGAWRWIRTASRWDVIHGDTGNRDLSASLTNMTSGEVIVSRTGNLVTLDFGALSPSAAFTSGSPMLILPAGFRPASNLGWAQSTSITGGGWRSMYVLTNGRFGVWAPNVADAYTGVLTYRTADAWPTT